MHTYTYYSPISVRLQHMHIYNMKIDRYNDKSIGYSFCYFYYFLIPKLKPKWKIRITPYILVLFFI